MRDRATPGQGCGAQEGARAHHSPDQCQVRKEIRLGHLGRQGAFGTLRDTYLAPWAAGGEHVSSAMRMPAMLKEAGEPDSSSSRKTKSSSPFLSQ